MQSKALVGNINEYLWDERVSTGVRQPNMVLRYNEAHRHLGVREKMMLSCDHVASSRPARQQAVWEADGFVRQIG